MKKERTSKRPRGSVRADQIALSATGKMRCAKCGEEKSIDQFPSKGKHRDGVPRYSYCKPCHSTYQRIQKLARQFNLTVEDYETIFNFQGGVCGACKRPPIPGKARLAVDHNHKTGLIRGLVCAWCNRVMGLLRDDADRFASMATYLTTPPAVIALNGERFGRLGGVGIKAATRKRLERAAAKTLLARPVEARLRDTRGEGT